MKKSVSLLAVVLSFFSALAEPNLDLLKRSINQSAVIKFVKPTVIPGLYEVLVNGEVLYLTEDGEKVISGDLYDLKQQLSYTDLTKNTLRKTAMDSVKEEDMIVYKAKNEKYRVTVFTDITCPYCTKLHNHVDELNDKGVTVQYLAFPRAGVGSPAQKRMQDIWCAADRQTALTKAKVDQQYPTESCQGEETAEQFLLGQEVGVNATPTMIFSDGELQAGYVQPAPLLKILQEKFPEAVQN